MTAPMTGPVPYRVSTDAIRQQRPREVTVTELIAIKGRIEPRENFWQFRIPPLPAHAILALRVWAITVGVGAVGITAWLYLFGGHR